jgi:hypothetical protein
LVIEPGNFDLVGGRIIARRQLAISRRREIGTLVLVLSAGLVPALAFMIGIAATLRPDLSDLSSIRSAEGGAVVLNWPSLVREGGGPNAGPRTGVDVRALGYMMESDRVPRDGEWVREFYLLPDAGNMFHPAHRDGDQMIAVQLADDARVRFSQGELVWVWGSFRSLPGEDEESKPFYTLERAHARRADESEIRRYFR